MIPVDCIKDRRKMSTDSASCSSVIETQQHNIYHIHKLKVVHSKTYYQFMVRTMRLETPPSRIFDGLFHSADDAFDHENHVIQADEPNVSELALLCLDYLRSLRRSSSSSNLGDEIGIDQDYLTLSIWALSNSLTKPRDLNHGSLHDAHKSIDNPLKFGNDSFFHPKYKLSLATIAHEKKTFKVSDKLQIPTLKVMEIELMHKFQSPNFTRSMDSDERMHLGSQIMHKSESSMCYSYEDQHCSNQYRFYENFGLASTLPLTLPHLVTSGIRALGAKSRHQAEKDMMADELFQDFFNAVTKDGFFHVTDREIFSYPGVKSSITDEEITALKAHIHQNRYQKVVAKFRTKLAAKYEHNTAAIAIKNTQQRKQVNSSYYNNDGNLSVHYEESHTHTASPTNDELNASQEDDSTLVAKSLYGDTESSMEQSRISLESGFVENLDLFGDAISTINEEDCEPKPPRGKDIVNNSSEFYSKVSHVEESAVGPKDTKAQSSDQSKLSLGISVKAVRFAERLQVYGNAAMHKKKYQKAKDYYTKALDLVPNGPTAHVYYSNRAAALLSLRDFDAAVLDAKKSIELKPNYAKAHSRLGLANLLLENYQEAVDAYSLAVEHDPKHKTNASYLEKSKRKLSLEVILKEDINEVPETNHTAQDKDNDIAPTRPDTAASNHSSKIDLTDEPKRWISLDPSISVRSGRDPPEEIKDLSKVDASPSFRVQKDPPGLKALTIPVFHTPIVDRLEAVTRSRISIDPEFNTSAMDRLKPVRKTTRPRSANDRPKTASKTTSPRFNRNQLQIKPYTSFDASILHPVYDKYIPKEDKAEIFVSEYRHNALKAENSAVEREIGFNIDVESEEKDEIEKEKRVHMYVEIEEEDTIKTEVKEEAHIDISEEKPVGISVDISQEDFTNDHIEEQNEQSINEFVQETTVGQKPSVANMNPCEMSCNEVIVDKHDQEDEYEGGYGAQEDARTNRQERSVRCTESHDNSKREESRQTSNQDSYDRGSYHVSRKSSGDYSCERSCERSCESSYNGSRNDSYDGSHIDSYDDHHRGSYEDNHRDSYVSTISNHAKDSFEVEVTLEDSRRTRQCQSNAIRTKPLANNDRIKHGGKSSPQQYQVKRNTSASSRDRERLGSDEGSSRHKYESYESRVIYTSGSSAPSTGTRTRTRPKSRRTPTE
jgi:tetratricopeptide (TPR) repeat protein